MNCAIKIAKRRTRGFTLVELLVVIAIIGILAGMLMPAVSSVRDAARRTDNQNNLRSIGQAIQTYEQSRKVYPPLVKVHEKDLDQPLRKRIYSTSWAFELLPYLDQQVIYDKRDPSRPCSQAPDPSELRKSNDVAFLTPLTVFANSRRRDGSASCPFADNDQKRGTCIDYAANAGYVPEGSNFQPAALDPEDPMDESDKITSSFDTSKRSFKFPLEYDPKYSGPFSIDSNARISQASVRDGISNVIAVGDRFFPDLGINSKIHDEVGLAGASIWTIMRFANADTKFNTYYPFDMINDASPYKFGSPRGADTCYVFLDGHIRWVSYDKDHKVMLYMSAIADGNPVSDVE